MAVDPRLVRLLDLLDAADGETVGKSVGLPVACGMLLWWQRSLIQRAAAEIVSIIDDPTPDEVLSYAAGLAAAA